MKQKRFDRITAPVLAKTAGTMLPLYKQFVRSRAFAEQWCVAVRQADLDTLMKMLRSQIPNAPIESFATNGIGFFVDLNFPAPMGYYTNGTSIPPGKVQFTFNPYVVRRISLAILPLYRALACSPLYTKAVVSAIRLNDQRKLNQLIRIYIPSKQLIGTQIIGNGFSLAFKYPSSNNVYVNEFFYESL